VVLSCIVLELLAIVVPGRCLEAKPAALSCHWWNRFVWTPPLKSSGPEASITSKHCTTDRPVSLLCRCQTQFLVKYSLPTPSADFHLGSFFVPVRNKASTVDSKRISSQGGKCPATAVEPVALLSACSEPDLAESQLHLHFTSALISVLQTQAVGPPVGIQDGSEVSALPGRRKEPRRDKSG
jgi:hypothetical protein